MKSRKPLSLKEIKIIAVLMAMAVTFYPVFELSRCIIVYDIAGGWAPGWQGFYLADFWAELICAIWLGYFILLPLVMNWVVNLAVKYGRAHAVH